MFSDSERSPSASPSVNKHRRADRPSQKQPNTAESVGQGRALEPPLRSLSQPLTSALLHGCFLSPFEGCKWSNLQEKTCMTSYSQPIRACYSNPTNVLILHTKLEGALSYWQALISEFRHLPGVKCFLITLETVLS